MSAREDNVAERNVELAMLIMVFAMLLLPAIDALAKVLSATVPVGLIVWSRFAFQTTLLAPDALRKQHSAQSGLQLTHATRGGLLALTPLMFIDFFRRTFNPDPVVRGAPAGVHWLAADQCGRDRVFWCADHYPAELRGFRAARVVSPGGRPLFRALSDFDTPDRKT